jgi:hypothetical protein
LQARLPRLACLALAFPENVELTRRRVIALRLMGVDQVGRMVPQASLEPSACW